MKKHIFLLFPLLLVFSVGCDNIQPDYTCVFTPGDERQPKIFSKKFNREASALKWCEKQYNKFENDYGADCECGLHCHADNEYDERVCEKYVRP